MASEGRLIVCKVGSSTLLDDAGNLDRAYIAELCSQAASIQEKGDRLIIVSSGAAAAGREILGFGKRPSDVPTLQACAATGQATLTQVYAAALAEHGIPCGQVLLTRRDVVDRESYLNARNTFERLLDLGVVPVVNENDTTSVSEFAFGDNDMLGAIVSALVQADLYVILSDVAGLYTANPDKDPTATLIEHVYAIDETVSEMAGDAVSGFGTGGMASKVRAARAMIAAGIPTVICHGRKQGVLADVVDGKDAGTRFEPRDTNVHGTPRKLWIGLAEMPHGTIALDEGASAAVLERGASILPVGITRSEGSYQVGDVVNVVDSADRLIGRGIARYSSEDMQRYRGLKLEVIARFAGQDGAGVAVHRDELLVF